MWGRYIYLAFSHLGVSDIRFISHVISFFRWYWQELSMMPSYLCACLRWLICSLTWGSIYPGYSCSLYSVTMATAASTWSIAALEAASLPHRLNDLWTSKNHPIWDDHMIVWYVCCCCLPELMPMGINLQFVSVFICNTFFFPAWL
jgi:hypothetical protein